MRRAGANAAELGTRLREARGLLDRITKEIHTGSPNFGARLKTASEILSHVPDNGALAASVATSHGTIVLAMAALQR